MYMLVCICIHLVDFLLPQRLWLAGRGGAGKEGPERLFLSSLLAAARVEAWLEGLLLLLLALAAPAGDLKNALLHRRLGLACPFAGSLNKPQDACNVRLGLNISCVSFQFHKIFSKMLVAFCWKLCPKNLQGQIPSEQMSDLFWSIELIRAC